MDSEIGKIPDIFHEKSNSFEHEIFDQKIFEI